MKRNILRYPKLLLSLWQFSFVEEMEYRSNFFANLLNTVASLGLALLTVQVFFMQTDEIGGWNVVQVMVLLGVFNALEGVVEMFLRPNIGRIVQHIRKGTFDLILTKPVDSQFYVSFRHIVFWPITDVILGLGLVLYGGVYLMGIQLTFTSVFLFLLLFLSAVATLYAIWMILMTISFWFVKVENLTFLFSSLFETARFPVSVYKGALRFLLTFVFPVAVLTTFPAAAFVGTLEAGDVLISLSVMTILLVISRRFWKKALRHYSSASS
jgi:ABC-2 type transport system permease protein